MIIEIDKTVNGQVVKFWEVQSLSILPKQGTMELGLNGYIDYEVGSENNFIFATETIKVEQLLTTELEILIDKIIKDNDSKENV